MSVVSSCLGSQEPGGGVVLGSDMTYAIFMYIFITYLMMLCNQLAIMVMVCIIDCM